MLSSPRAVHSGQAMTIAVSKYDIVVCDSMSKISIKRKVEEMLRDQFEYLFIVFRTMCCTTGT